MVFLFKRQNIIKKGAKIRLGYQCMGCGKKFQRKRSMQKHQGDFWPYCTPVDNSAGKSQ